MMEEKIDMCAPFIRHRLYHFEFELDPDRWDSMDKNIKDIVSRKWCIVKYLNDDGTKLNDEFKNVPNDRGGIYSFVLKPELVPEYHAYIMYIGRARRKKEFSLKKRCRTYLNEKDRSKIQHLITLYGRKLYLIYLPLDDDELIERVEDELLKAILPPCNTRYPDYDIMPSKAAF